MQHGPTAHPNVETASGPSVPFALPLAMSNEREHIDPNDDDRYIRRRDDGTIKESDDVGRSLRQDVKQPAETEVKPGHGDRGDQKRD